MKEPYTAEVVWERGSQDFLDNRYSRRHQLRFDGGTVVPASSSPQSVPVPLSVPAGVDPEEAFVASLASCHMLWFLSIAAKAGFRVDTYHDSAAGTLARRADGKVAMTVVTLRPRVVFSGSPQPDRAQLDALHHQAHAECFIANSVTADVRCEPVFVAA